MSGLGAGLRAQWIRSWIHLRKAGSCREPLAQVDKQIQDVPRLHTFPAICADPQHTDMMHPEVPEFVIMELDGTRHPALDGAVSSGITFQSRPQDQEAEQVRGLSESRTPQTTSLKLTGNQVTATSCTLPAPKPRMSSSQRPTNTPRNARSHFSRSQTRTHGQRWKLRCFQPAILWKAQPPETKTHPVLWENSNQRSAPCASGPTLD